MVEKLAGLKIRSLRRKAGLTQSELARRAGISASYLTLIEGNKRTVNGALLNRIAAGLGVERTTLDGSGERQLAESLREVAADPALGARSIPPASPEELVGRYPVWADLILRLYGAFQDERQMVMALADRLSGDPFLAESVHRILTGVTAIRSAAEILADQGALRDEERDRFASMIANDSDKLSATARSLVAFFDNPNVRVRSATPMEHVDAFLFETDNHFPTLEAGAEEFLAGLRPAETVEAAAVRMTGPAADTPRSRIEPSETRRFRLVRAALAPIVEAEARRLVGQHAALGSEEARELALVALLNYATGAVLMPYEPFLRAAEEARYDLDRLSRLFGVSYEQASHRLATLRRRGDEGVRFAFMRSDPSGYVTKRLPLQGLPLPRYGTACPLWPVYRAFQTPGVTIASFGELPTGDQFLFFARAVEKNPPLAGLPRHLLSVMLACPVGQAGRVGYGDGIDRKTAMIPAGVFCRLCPRPACVHRQEPSLIA
jgi:predicted transcriptional regulator/transcriptional regulator with XRE-family HTH domain